MDKYIFLAEWINISNKVESNLIIRDKLNLISDLIFMDEGSISYIFIH